MVSAGSSSITSTRARLSAALARHALGSSNQNVLPTPSLLSKPMRPPCAVTISWQSASPRPVPPIARVSEESTRKKRVKTCAFWSFGMPRPESLTVTRAKPSRGTAVIVTAPPAGEYLIALESRLAITWPMRLRSPTIASGSSGVSNSSWWLRGLRREELDLVLEQLAELERLEREREAPGLDLLHVEEVVDQGRQALRLAVDRLQVAASGVVVEVVMHEQLGEAEHARERRAQLVRDGGDELGLEPRGIALGRDLAHDDDAADQLAGRVVHGARVALERAPDVGELEVVAGRAFGIGGDRLHGGEVRGGVGQAVGDRRSLLQRRVLGNAEDLSRQVLDHRVREQRAALEVDQADAVDARIEQGAVDVDEALERDLVRLHRDLVRLHGDLMGLQAVGLQLESGVLALEAGVAAGFGAAHRDVGRELTGGSSHAPEGLHDCATEVEREDEDQERRADDAHDACPGRPARRLCRPGPAPLLTRLAAS